MRGQVARHRVKIAVTTSGLPAQCAKVTDSPLSSVQFQLWLNSDAPGRAALGQQEHLGINWMPRADVSEPVDHAEPIQDAIRDDQIARDVACAREKGLCACH